MVQGVGYRYFVVRAAQRLGLDGYVKNLRDGRVEVYAAGMTDSLDSLRASLESGPQGASVSGVYEEIVPRDLRFEDGFSIEFDAG